MPTQQVAVEPARPFLGLGVKLTPQARHALLILAQRCAAPSLPVVQSHERAVHGFLGGIEAEQVERCLHGSVDPPRAHPPRQELSQRLHGQLVQPPAFGEQPLLERHRLLWQAGQQVATVKGSGARQRGLVVPARQAFELGHVGRDGILVQADRVSRGHDKRGAAGEQATDRHDGLPQALASGVRRHVTPEQCRELVARMPLVTLEGEVRQQCLGLAPTRDHGRTIGEPGLEAAQKRQAKTGQPALQCGIDRL